MDALLRRIALRDLDVGRISAGDGTVRAILVLPTWDDYLATALDEIIALRTPLPTIVERVTRLLDDLRMIAPPARHPAIDRRRAAVSD